MRVKSELVVCSSVSPKGQKLFVEVASLMLLPTVFYDEATTASGVRTDEIDGVDGWLTIIGFKLYRVRKIDEQRVAREVGVDNMAFYEVTVNWDDLDVKPIPLKEKH